MSKQQILQRLGDSNLEKNFQNFFFFQKKLEILNSFFLILQPLLKHTTVLPIFLKSQEIELSTARWLNREPQQILVECTVDNFPEFNLRGIAFLKDKNYFIY